MPRRLFIIVCILILTACQPAAMPVSTETVAQSKLTPAATITPLPPSATPSPEPSPTLKPPAKPVELKPVPISETGKSFDFTAAASQYPDLVDNLQKVLTGKLQSAINKTPDHQKAISIAVGVDENGVKTLWLQAGLQPLVAMDSSGLIIPPVDLIARINEIDSFTPLGWPTYPLAAGSPTRIPPVPRFIKSYASITKGGENRIIAYDSANQAVAYWVTSDGKGLWMDNETNQPLPVYMNKDSANFGQWLQPYLPVKDGKPDFSFNPDHWFTVPEGQATAENYKLWIAYYMDWVKATYPNPTGEVQNTHFIWGPTPDSPLRSMHLPPVGSNLPLANAVLPGMTFENVLINLETGKKEDLHIFPFRILRNSGEFGLVPVAISQWEFKLTVQANNYPRFRDNITSLQITAPSIEFVASGDLSLRKVSGAMAQLVRLARALIAARWINNQDLSAARDWIETHFSVDGYNGLKYNPDVLPPNLPFVIGGVVVY